MVLCGCSPGPVLVDVSGRVTVGGAAAGPGFIVTFVPDAGGRPSQAVTDDNGGYRVRFTEHRAGVVPGSHRVVVSWPYVEGMGPPNPMRNRLPAAVESLADTPFAVDVQAATVFDIDLAQGGLAP